MITQTGGCLLTHNTKQCKLDERYQTPWLPALEILSSMGCLLSRNRRFLLTYNKGFHGHPQEKVPATTE
eukprot:7217254-Karenia_brevis.AAC.1